ICNRNCAAHDDFWQNRAVALRPGSAEQFLQIRKSIHDEEPAIAVPDLLALEGPGPLVRHEHGAYPGFESGIDIRFRAVADHPRSTAIEAARPYQILIRHCVLFLHDPAVGE